MAKSLHADKEKAIADINKKYESVNKRIAFIVLTLLVIIILGIILLNILAASS